MWSVLGQLIETLVVVRYRTVKLAEVQKLLLHLGLGRLRQVCLQKNDLKLFPGHSSGVMDQPVCGPPVLCSRSELMGREVLLLNRSK
jgi:hypothetical protein